MNQPEPQTFANISIKTIYQKYGKTQFTGRCMLQYDFVGKMVLKKKGKNRWGIKIKESGKMKGKLTKKYTVLITTKAQTGRQERS